MYMYGVRAAVFKSERERERERMSDTNGRGAEQQSRRCEPGTNGSEKETGEQKREREGGREGEEGERERDMAGMDPPSDARPKAEAATITDKVFLYLHARVQVRYDRVY